jgi:hypothetical protein
MSIRSLPEEETTAFYFFEAGGSISRWRSLIAERYTDGRRSEEFSGPPRAAKWFLAPLSLPATAIRGGRSASHQYGDVRSVVEAEKTRPTAEPTRKVACSLFFLSLVVLLMESRLFPQIGSCGLYRKAPPSLRSSSFGYFTIHPLPITFL